MFDYKYDPDQGVLTLISNGKTIIAEKGRTHLLVNGEENLLNGEPYVREDGAFIAEINAIIPYIKDATSYYDNKIKVFRIELPKGET